MFGKTQITIIFFASLMLGMVGAPIAHERTHDYISVTLKAGEAVYTTLVDEGSTVYDAMEQLSSTTPFRFKAISYPSLGYFIQEINGVRNAHGTYWTLYINNVYATVGASAYIVHDGDEIEWKYEKN